MYFYNQMKRKDLLIIISLEITPPPKKKKLQKDSNNPWYWNKNIPVCAAAEILNEEKDSTLQPSKGLSPWGANGFCIREREGYEHHNPKQKLLGRCQ